VRIWTPGGELPFAGHPTLGSCHSWLEAGGKAKSKDFIVQECKVGLVRIRREAGSQRLAFAAPPLKRSAPSPQVLAQMAAALGLKAPQILAAQVLENGPVWFSLLLDSPETVLSLSPQSMEFQKLQQHVGVAALYPPDSRGTAPSLIGRANREARAFGASGAAASGTDIFTPDLEVRALIASSVVYEDPVTGSLNAALAQWLMAEGHLPDRYLASQGTCIGRAGQVHVERDGDGVIWVGGETSTCITGTVSL
jgi:PhzF family phenazine biosynthesis protein